MAGWAAVAPSRRWSARRSGRSPRGSPGSSPWRPIRSPSGARASTVFPMTCNSGGTVEIYLEPVLPAPRLVVFGVSPTARALVKLGKAMGYSVIAVDPAAEPVAFPEADQVRHRPRPGAALSRRQGPALRRGGDSRRARRGGDPRRAGPGAGLSRRRGEPPGASPRCARPCWRGGVTAAALDAIRSPAGVNIGAETPEEIALSILAEIVERRRAEPAAEEVDGSVRRGRRRPRSIRSAA